MKIRVQLSEVKDDGENKVLQFEVPHEPGNDEDQAFAYIKGLVSEMQATGGLFVNSKGTDWIAARLVERIWLA